MAICEGSNVRYNGELPVECSPAGYVLIMTRVPGGVDIATVRFDTGEERDVPVTALTLDRADAWQDDDGE